MKKRAVIIGVILVFLVLFVSTQALGVEYVYSTILNSTISTSTAGTGANLAGYREFSLLGRITGTAGATVSLEIYFSGYSVYRELITIPSTGWLNYTKSFPVYAPNAGFVFYSPSSPMTINMTCYAGL